MGAFWLHDLPPALAEAGLDVRYWPGWETRSRSTGGFDRILGVLCHHTAGPQDGEVAARFHWDTHPDRPVANFTLDRSGVVWFGAAGASNHAGKGAGRVMSKGTIPLDQGNRYLIGIEACNEGTGEVWPQAQLEAYVKLVAVLCKVYGLDVHRDVIAHYEYAPDRKIDPAGGVNQFPYAILTDRYLRWDMNRFRADVVTALATNPNPPEEDMQLAKARIKGYADQFLLVPLTAGSNERIGAVEQAPIVVSSSLSKAQLDAEFGYGLTPTANGQ